MTNQTTNPTITEQARASLMLVRLRTSSITFNLSDKEARERLAAADHVDKSMYRVNRTLLPPDYAAALTECRKIISAGRSYYEKTTMPFGRAANGTEAQGERAVTAALIMDNWVGDMQQYAADLNVAVRKLSADLPFLMQQIATDPRYAAGFRADLYPTPQEVIDGFSFVVEGPDPIGSFDYLPMTGELADSLAANFENRIADSVRFGQQKTAGEVLELVQRMAKNLSEFAKYELGDKGSRNKTPRITKTLTTNLTDVVDKIRQFTLPTAEGDALLALADRIERELVPPGRVAEHFKDNVGLARVTAERAAALASDIESLDIGF